MRSLCPAFALFWQRFPAFLYGLALLLACSWFFKPSLYLIFPSALLFGPLLFFPCYKDKALVARLLGAFTLFVVALAMLSQRYILPKLPDDGVFGLLLFAPQNISKQKHPFGEQWVYRGQIARFTPFADQGWQEKQRGGCCLIRLPVKAVQAPPKADKSYLVEGKLRQVEGSAFGQYTLSGISKSWQEQENSWSSAAWRQRAKQSVREYIFAKMPSPHAAAFLAGIVTGEFDDQLLSFHFGRFGLQHIMAISGFHFALIAAFCSTCLAIFCPPKITSVLLILLLSFYCFFVGPAPSVVRAWVAICVAFMGQVIARTAFGLNSLGVGLLLVLLFEPLALANWGFQFSFGITAAILLFMPACQQLWQWLFPQRALSVTVQMDYKTQHAYILLHYLKNGLALSLAANLVTIPLSLAHFHKFPLLGLVYNLFYPLGIALVMQLFLFVVMLSWLLPFLSGLLFGFLDGITSWFLKLTYNMPISLDFIWYSSAISAELVIVWLTLLLFAAILGQKQQGSPLTTML